MVCWFLKNIDLEYKRRCLNFSPQIVRENLKRCEQAIKNKFHYWDYVQQIWKTYFSKKDQAGISWIEESLFAVLPELKSFSDICELEGAGNISDGIILTSTHANTADILRAAKQNSFQARIAVVCVDAHADLYETNLPLWKGNVFSYLLREEVIDCLILLGVPKFRQNLESYSLPRDLQRKIVFINKTKPDQIAKMILTQFQERIITNYFYSLDLDGFDLVGGMYTAMEYCPFHVMVNLGQKVLDICSEEVARKTLTEAVFPRNLDGTHKNLEVFGTYVKTTTVSILHRALLAQKTTCSGVIVGNIRIIGDITEIWGLDWEGKTSQLITDLVQILIIA